LIGRDAVAVVAKRRRGLDRLAAGRLQVSQRDDVAVVRGQVPGGMDLQRHRARLAGVGIDVGPDRPPLAGLGVDEDDGLRGIAVATDVVDRHRAGAIHGRRAVQAGHLEDDRLTRAEAVVQVVWPSVDVLPVDVRGHRRRLQIDPASGEGVGVLDRVVVVRERQQAQPPVRLGDEVAAVGVAGVDQRQLLA
jgi:hypothetical protein